MFELVGRIVWSWKSAFMEDELESEKCFYGSELTRFFFYF